MNKLIYLVIICSLLIGCQDKPDVIKTKSGLYGSKEGGFLIKFPREPDVFVQDSKVDLYDTKIVSFINNVGDWHRYAVSYQVLPEEIFNNWEPEQLFDHVALNNVYKLDNFNFTIKKKEIEEDSEFELSIYYELVTLEEFKNYQFHLRMIKVGSRVYSIYFFAIKKIPKKEEIKEFLTSFKLFTPN